MSEYDSANFDAMNSSELIAHGIRKIKTRVIERFEKAQKRPNPHKLPSDKQMKAAKDVAELDELYKQVVAYWQEEAFKMGYTQALSEVNSDIKKAGI